MGLRLGIMDGGRVELERDAGRPFAVLGFTIRKGLARVDVEYPGDDPWIEPGAVLLHYLSAGSAFTVDFLDYLIDGRIEAIDRKRGRVVVVIDAPREIGVYRPEYRAKLAASAPHVEGRKEGCCPC